MKKRLFAGSLALAMLVSLFPIPALAAEQTHVERVQALIDALPDEVTADNAEEVSARLAAIDEARLDLTDEETDTVDFTRYQAAVAALLALEGQAGADEPELLAEGTGDFTVEGGTPGEDYSYADGVLTILKETSLTISGTTTTDKIVVGDNVAANITFSNLSIQHSAVDSCAFLIPGTSRAYITLSGSNTLQSGENYAGLSVKRSGRVELRGDGALRSTGGRNAAGIGGGHTFDAGEIGIYSGTITAVGGMDGAGIGGGHSNNRERNQYGNFGIIDIRGGVIDAYSPGNAAAIGSGCWAQRTGGEIILYDAQVTAKTDGSHKRCAAIGRGISIDDNDYACKVTIKNSIISAENVAGKGNAISGRSYPSILYSIVRDTSRDDKYKDSYTVYQTYTLQEPWTLPADRSLVIEKGTTLNIPDTVTLQNNGTIVKAGTINGEIQGNQPVTVEPISYRTCDGAGRIWSTGERQDWTYVLPGMTNWSDGWYAVTGSITIPTRVTVSGDVHLILRDGCELNANAGIVVDGSSTLSIYAQSTGDNMGRLTARSTRGPGIGSGGGESRITINGGYVKAYGAWNEAGIGSGYQAPSGAITINGGHVYAAGDGGGAGIGGGSYGTAGAITINGGYVEADSLSGAGIGSGFCAGGGAITITGGTVIAKSTGEGDGIGGGPYGDASSITISGSNTVVIACSNYSRSSPLGSPNITRDGGGLIIESDRGRGTGALYSSSVTLGDSITIPEGVTVTVGSGKTLTIPKGIPLKVDGLIQTEGNGKVTIQNKNDVTVLVKYDYNGAPQDGNESAYYVYGGTYGQLLPKPAWAGHTFLGWFTDKTGGTEVTGTSTVNTFGGHTLHARWRENKSNVTVTFTNGTPTYGDTITITATITPANSNSLRTAEQDKVTFSLGDTTLGTADVSGNMATLQVHIYGPDWKPETKTITAEFGGSAAYMGSTGTGTLEVQKVTPQVTPPEAITELIYTGSAQELIRGGSTTDGTLQYSTDNVSYSERLPQGTDAGPYDVYYRVKGDEYYHDVTAESMPVAIGRKSIDGAEVILGDSLTYTGEEQAQTVRSVTIDGLPATYDVSGNTGTDADDYTLTVTGNGNFTGDQTAQFTIAKAVNYIANLTCKNIVFGDWPNPSAETAFGTPTFTYSRQEEGPYSEWDTANPKGPWFVKAAVAGTKNYDEVAATTSFEVTVRQENFPDALISYPDELLTDLAADARYSITPEGGTAVTVTVNENGVIAIQEDWLGKTLSIVKIARNDNYSDSEAQSLSVPTRPDAPTEPLKLTKTANGITITNSYSGCEFSAGGDTWQDSQEFTDLIAGQTYPVSVRIKATDNSFCSEARSQSVTTVNADGSATVEPGESVEFGADPTTTVTNDGENVTITTDGTTTTVTPAPAGGVKVDEGGNVTVPEGTTVQTGDDGPEITVGPENGGAVGGDGGITVPEDGTVQIGKDPVTTITPPAGGEVKPNPGGTVEVPGGTTVQTGDDGPEITVGPGNGGTVDGDGGITVPENGTVQIGKDPATTITPPTGGEVTPREDGTVEVPEGTTVQTGNGPALTVGPGNGGTVGGDGGVTVEEGGKVTVEGDPATIITLPDGGTVKPNPDGTIPLPGGAIIERDGTTGPVTVPPVGGAYHPDTGAVTGNVHPVPPGSQGGFASIIYPPTVIQPQEGGSVSVKPARPSMGDTVTITPQPEDGYEVAAVRVTDSSGRPVEVKQAPDGTYSFTQPSGRVKIEVTYRPVETAWNNPFGDVDEAAWYYDAVRFVSEHGLMGAYGNGQFGVNDSISRAQFVQILFHKEGRPVVNYLLQYGDVAAGTWYTEAVRWATSQGIVGGYANGNFGPNDPITREQLAVMLWRYSGSPAATNKELYFHDADEISGFAWEAMRWALENGIINGYGSGRLVPQGQATRAQAAQILKNFLENRENGDH